MRGARPRRRRLEVKPGGKPPKPPTPGPKAQDQINLTDEDSRIMPVPGGGFEQAYNAQAAVAAEGLLVVATDVTSSPNDKEQVEPMLAQMKALPEAMGKVERLLADAGFCSRHNVEACEKAGIEPLLAIGREAHHEHWRERFAEPPALAAEATPMQRMAYRLKTKAGRALYALRKQTMEPVFGIIKSVMGFRQFLLRGLDQVRSEWRLVSHVEFEAHGRIASTSFQNGVKVREKAKMCPIMPQIAHFLSNPCLDQTFRNSSPTGC